MSQDQPVIVAAIRTAIGRARADVGIFRHRRADEISADVICHLAGQTGGDPHSIEDVRWGCAHQRGEQGFNVARTAVLLAGLPDCVPGVTINRLCASSLQAVIDCGAAIQTGLADVQIAGGVEHMEHLPPADDVSPPAGLVERIGLLPWNMGQTAEVLAEKYRITREEQDLYSLRSHQLADLAQKNGASAGEILPVAGKDPQGVEQMAVADHGVRSDTSLEKLATLKPAFKKPGTVTAGNSSQLSVGAAGVVVMRESTAKNRGLGVLGRIRASTVVGVAPSEMGIGPAPAIRKLLQKSGLSWSQIGAIEINEAFAAQTLAVLKDLGESTDRVNMRGGAIALGHPLGASGARILVTLLHRMQVENVRWGIASLCVGMGQGVAILVERG